MATRISTGYNPRPLQKELHRNFRRFNVLVAHRRFGKTILTINEMIDQALNIKLENGRYAYIAPYYHQAKTIAWDYLKKYTQNLPQTSYNESELRCDLLNGSRIRLFGADNPNALRGLYFDGVILDEYAQINPTLWGQVIRPALSDRKGWAIFIGTPKGYNQFYDIYEFARTTDNADWFSGIFRASETKIIDEKELFDAKQTMTVEEYAQEYECSFNSAIRGSYYGHYLEDAEKEGRIGNIPYDKSAQVYTAWDIGVGDSTAIWFFQQIGRELRIIDYYENCGQGLEHYAFILKNKPYIYGKHYAPHDIMVREFGTGKSRFEMAQSLGIGFTLAPRLSLEDGINAVRLTLPYCWFNKNTTFDGIQCLKQYRADYDDKRETFRKNPLHDWTSHGADAFRYLAVAYRENNGLSAKILDSRPTLNDILREYDKSKEDSYHKI